MKQESMEESLRRIKKHTDELAELEDQLRDFQTKSDDISIPIRLKIALELDDKGKPKYSNEQKREGEFHNRISNVVNYAVFSKHIFDTLQDIEKAKRQIRYAELEFSMWKALCYAQKE